MQNLKRCLLVLGSLSSLPALAYSGDGRRPEKEPHLFSDISQEALTITAEGNYLLHTSLSNQLGSKRLLCDIVSSIQVQRGTERMSLLNFIDRRVVEPHNTLIDSLTFEATELNDDWKFVPGSQSYQSSCLILEANEDPKQVPSPHESCDPEYNVCDWVCRVDPSQPTTCLPEPGF